MAKYHLIEGNKFIDERGLLISFNEFDMTAVKRFYLINHPNIDVVRAWQGHKIETKWFYVIKGAFIINLIVPNKWTNPSIHQSVETFIINQTDNVILKIPAGNINGFKATIPKSELMVFSDTTLNQSKDDDYRFDKLLWYNWDNLTVL